MRAHHLCQLLFLLPSLATTTSFPPLDTLGIFLGGLSSQCASDPACETVVNAKCADAHCACVLQYHAQDCVKQCARTADSVNLFNDYLDACVTASLAIPTSTQTVYGKACTASATSPASGGGGTIYGPESSGSGGSAGAIYDLPGDQTGAPTSIPAVATTSQQGGTIYGGSGPYATGAASNDQNGSGPSEGSIYNLDGHDDAGDGAADLPGGTVYDQSASGGGATDLPGGTVYDQSASGGGAAATNRNGGTVYDLEGGGGGGASPTVPQAGEVQCSCPTAAGAAAGSQRGGQIYGVNGDGMSGISTLENGARTDLLSAGAIPTNMALTSYSGTAALLPSGQRLGAGTTQTEALNSTNSFFSSPVSQECVTPCAAWKAQADSCTNDACLCVPETFTAARDCNECVGSSALGVHMGRCYSEFSEICQALVPGITNGPPGVYRGYDSADIEQVPGQGGNANGRPLLVTDRDGRTLAADEVADYTTNIVTATAPAMYAAAAQETIYLDDGAGCLSVPLALTVLCVIGTALLLV